LPNKNVYRTYDTNSLLQLLEEAVSNLFHLYRQAQNNTSSFTPAHLQHAEAVIRICREISAAPNIKVHTLAYFSREYALSESTLKRSFKKTTGLTIHRFVTEECMKQAAILRLDKNMSFDEIADILGYSDKSGFARTLKRLTGKSLKMTGKSV